VIVFELRTLLRLDVDLEEVRLRLAALFAPRGVTRPFRPVLRRIREAAREVGDPALERAGLAILDAWELAAAEDARARPGAPEVVAELAARGVGLGLCAETGRACVGAALAAAEIPLVFQAIVTRDDGPDPLGAARRRGAVWYVCEHPSEVAAGRGAGLRVAALRSELVPEAQLVQADVMLAGLEAVLGLDR
jgi:beta-phosphoglucomutase-like phosphatase (HAD superfamily)